MSDFKKTDGILNSKFASIMKNATSKHDKLYVHSFYNIFKNVHGTVNEDTLHLAVETAKKVQPANINDFYFIALKSAMKTKQFKKKAYPQDPLILSDDYDREFNMDKWSDLVYKIYDDVLSKRFTLNEAVDYYANNLNKKKEEDVKFKRWLKYHISGENFKYSKEKQLMKKDADYQFGLNNSNFYYPEYGPEPEVKPPHLRKTLENKLDDADKKQELAEWKKKLDGAIRRIDKLIRSVDHLLDSDKASELAQSLHDFDMSVRKVRHSVTASDLTYRTAHKFKKMGFDDGHNILLKVAQEVETEPVDEQQQIDLQEPEKDNVGPTSDDPLKRVYDAGSGAYHGEYEDLAGNIDLRDAVEKLEQIAARLSDRRVVRLLAEFDIMLDKIGIAAMFPELAEAQSKLIDAYSYSQVRVTKMLGMLSSGMSLSEISETRKDEMTHQIRKGLNRKIEEVNSGLPGDTPQRGAEVIQEEFQEPREPEQQPNITQE